MIDDAMKKQISQLEATIADLEDTCARKDDELVAARKIADEWESAYETLSDGVHTLYDKAVGNKRYRTISPEEICDRLIPFAESPWTVDDAADIRAAGIDLGTALQELLPVIRTFSEFSSPGAVGTVAREFNRLADRLGIDRWVHEG